MRPLLTSPSASKRVVREAEAESCSVAGEETRELELEELVVGDVVDMP
jgi:hypothetical protein